MHASPLSPGNSAILRLRAARTLRAPYPGPQALLLARGCVGVGLAGMPVLYTLLAELVPSGARASCLVTSRCMLRPCRAVGLVPCAPRTSLHGACKLGLGLLGHRCQTAAQVAVELFWTLGTVAEAGLAWLLLGPWGWRALLAASALPLALLLALLPWVPESPRFLAAQGRRQEASQVGAYAGCAAISHGDKADQLHCTDAGAGPDGEARWRVAAAGPAGCRMQQARHADCSLHAARVAQGSAQQPGCGRCRFRWRAWRRGGWSSRGCWGTRRLRQPGPGPAAASGGAGAAAAGRAGVQRQPAATAQLSQDHTAAGTWQRHP